MATANTALEELIAAPAVPARRGINWIVVAALPALLVLVLPVLIMIPMSFTATGVVRFPPQQWGLNAYRTLFADPEWRHVLLFSAQVATTAALLSAVAATLAGIALSRARIRGEGIVVAMILIPLAMPVIVLGLGAFQFFVRYRANGTLWSIALVHAVLGVPYVFLTARAALRRINYSMIQSAMSLGADSFAILRWIYLPLLAPAIGSGALLAFVVSFDEVVIALFLSGPTAVTLPVKLFNDLKFDLSPTIMAASTILLAAVVLAVIATGAVAMRRSRTAQ